MVVETDDVAQGGRTPKGFAVVHRGDGSTSRSRGASPASDNTLLPIFAFPLDMLAPCAAATPSTL
jgi:hypothetical protein